MQVRGGIIGMAALLLLAAGHAAAGSDPEDGRVAEGRYSNAYFGLSYTLPPGWREDRAGPRPSKTGGYALVTLTDGQPPAATLQFLAQDEFFAKAPSATALAAAQALRASLAGIDGMAIDREPAETDLAQHRFARLDYSGAGLYHAYLATILRCHVVSIVATAKDREALAKIVASLDALGLAAADDPTLPACRKDYASAATLRNRVEPTLTGPKFTAIPVRIVIGPDGTIQHRHVINALPAQREAIETALAQWQFAPAPAPIETGLSFDVK